MLTMVMMTMTILTMMTMIVVVTMSWQKAHPDLNHGWAHFAYVQRDRCKADITLRSSRAVPHPSTIRALCRLTSEVERDPVHLARYGRQRIC